MLVHDYLQRAAQRFPDKIALECGTDCLTYRTLASASRSFAGFLRTNGLQRGDRVAIFLDNCPETVIAIFGTLEAGGCFVVINHTTPTERVAYLLEHCSAKFLVAPATRLTQIREAESHCTTPPMNVLTGMNVIPPDGFTSFERACQYPVRTADLDGHIIDIDLAAIIYTSGSTGKPKGVTLTHRNIDTVVESVIEYLENDENDIILCLLQLSFGYGLLQVLTTFRTGGTLILEKGFGYPYEIVKRITQKKVTGFAGAPTLYAMLLQLQNLDKEDFSSLRFITNAAAALPPSFVPKLRKIFPNTKIYLMHGLTECLRTTYLPPDEVETRTTSVGTGMRNVELWIVDPEGKRLPPGQVGEMVVCGSNVMQGYWNDPEATAKVLRPGRYPWEKILHTRDLFRMDEDGYFYFVARMDDIIKSRGEKVSPREVEDVLYTLDEVLETRVIGVPDARLGNAIKAEIVLKDGRSISEMQVKAHCKQHLEDYKIPHIVEFVKSLPKSAGGKIKRTLNA